MWTGTIFLRKNNRKLDVISFKYKQRIPEDQTKVVTHFIKINNKTIILYILLCLLPSVSCFKIRELNMYVCGLGL